MDHPQESLDENIDRLKTRIKHLEKENQWYFSALEMIASLDEVHRGFSHRETPTTLFREAQPLLLRLLPLQTLALYLVDPSDSSFVLQSCHPEQNTSWVEGRVGQWVQDGSFAWALKQNRPVHLADPGGEGNWFLHSLATRSSILGMVAGHLPAGQFPLRSEYSKVLSIILQHIAQAMENIRLYRDMHHQNQNLERLVQIHTRDLKFKNEELEKRLEEIQDFAFIASHDLREPSRKVLVFGERLRSLVDVSVDPRAAKYLDAMERAAQKMDTLVNGLLHLSRVTTQARPVEHTDLNLLLQSALEDLSLKIEKSGARIHHDRLPVLPVDPHQIHQAFTLLLDNAIKFQPKGQAPHIQVSAHPDPSGFWEIQVKDNGIGIDPSQHEKIFKPFYRPHAKEDYPGSGLGLSIVRKIMERHGGTVRLESRAGEGSRFILMFPRKENGDPPA